MEETSVGMHNFRKIVDDVLIKTMLVTAPTFDIAKETRLHMDASTVRIGFVLVQRPKGSHESWKIVQAGSRFLTDTESRYAVSILL